MKERKRGQLLATFGCLTFGISNCTAIILLEDINIKFRMIVFVGISNQCILAPMFFIVFKKKKTSSPKRRYLAPFQIKPLTQVSPE